MSGIEQATALIARSYPGWTRYPQPGPRGNLDREVNAECLRQAQGIAVLLDAAGMLTSADVSAPVLPRRVCSQSAYYAPADAEWVGPGTRRWKNPFGDPRGKSSYTREMLVDEYREWLTTPVTKWSDRPAFAGSDTARTNLLGVPFEDRPSVEQIAALAGRDIACSCPLDQPCHADVLLDLANRS